MIQPIVRLWTRYSHVNWALADQTMVSSVNFLTGILVARYLGLEEFGRFTLAWMAVLFVNSIQHAAINSPMMSIGPKQAEAEAPAYYGAVVVQQIVFSCAVFFLLFAGVRLSGTVFPEWRVEGLAFPLAAAALAFQFQDFLRRYFFTRGRAAAAFANDAVRYLGQIAVLIWLFLSFRETMDSARVLWVIAIIAAAAAAYGAFTVGRIEVNAASLRTIASRHWHFSKWLTPSALMLWTTGNLFIIAAGALLGTTAVGAIRAAQNLMGITHILFQGLENIVPTRAARHFHVGGKKALFDYLRRVTLLGSGAMAIVAVIAAIAPDYWLALVYGDDYVGYGYLLQWWAAIYPLIFLTLPLRSGLQAIERTQVVFAAYCWMTLFSILAAYPLIQLMGPSGVVAGIFITNVILIGKLLFGLTTASSLKSAPAKR
ncbi:MAG: lipopolysaccharide biosynthesis protein [Pseudomonadota bacterium]